MSATLTPGTNALTLQVSDPGRDDLVGMKVWCSATSGFVPSADTLVYSGAGLSFTVISLPENVAHYVRYALISEIDPNDYEVSEQLSATPEPAAAGVLYNIEIESTNGDVFRPGQSLTTYLIAHVFRNGAEVTNDIDASRFCWRRVSYAPQPAPNDDASWNALYASGYKQIMVTANAVTSRATFHCDITTT